MAKEGISGTDKVMKHYVDISFIADGDVSAEVVRQGLQRHAREGKTGGVAPNIAVKLPMTRDGVKAIKYFTNKGIKTNCTLVFSSGQALLAAEGRCRLRVTIHRPLQRDISTDGVQLIDDIRTIYDNYGFTHRSWRPASGTLCTSCSAPPWVRTWPRAR